MKKIFLFFLIILALVGEASALKVSGRVLVQFEEGAVYENNVCIVPEGVYDFVLEPQGALADNINLEVDEVYLEKPGCVAYDFTMPSDMRPGMQKSSIRVTEKSPKGQGNIAAVVSVGHQIWVDVPYPGKYLNAKFTVGNADSGLEVPLSVRLTSKGFETIGEASSSVSIYDWNDALVGTVDLGSVSNIETQQTRVLEGIWDSTGNNVGDYRAVLDLEYDGIADSFEEGFKLGSLEVRIEDYTKQVFKEGIVQFTVTAESYWSQSIENARATVSVFDDNEVLLTSFETLTKNIDPWKTVSLTGYLDTSSLEIREYPVRVDLSYEGGSNFAEGVLSVVERPVEETPINLSTTTILLISTAILALIAILLGLKIIFGGEKTKKDEDLPGKNPPSFEKF